MATMEIERREATPKLISSFEVCKNDRRKTFAFTSVADFLCHRTRGKGRTA